MSKQQSNTRGKQSTAQKRASSRYGFGPIPATSKVQGATGGNQPVGRTDTEVNDHYTEETMRENAADVLNDQETVKEEAAFNTVSDSDQETNDREL